jgi:hypothetical protein
MFVLGGCCLLTTVWAGCNDSTAALSPARGNSAIVVDESAIAQPPSSEPLLSDASPAENQSAAAPALPPRETAAAQRPRADRGPSRPGQAEKITFDDLNLGMQADVVFRDFMLNDRVKELAGQRVSLVGYMHGGVSSKTIDNFVLLKNNQCKFGPGGQADHLARVFLREGKHVDFTSSDVKVEGTLRIDKFDGPDGNTWAIYRLDDAQVK